MSLPRDDRGAAMVEFGLAVIPFTVLVLLMLEVFLTVTQQHFLDVATQRAAHDIAMTGNVSEEDVTNSVCLNGLMLYSAAGCRAGLKVGIMPVTQGDPPAYALSLSGDLNTSAFTVDTGEQDSILLIRTAIAAPLTGIMGPWLASGAVTRISPYAQPATAGTGE